MAHRPFTGPWGDAAPSPDDFSGALKGRADCYVRLNQLDKALADDNLLVKMEADLGESFTLRGDTYFKLGRFRQALADYNQAIKLDTEPTTHNLLARAQAYEKLGDLPAAERDRAA